jgi:hypothetical protein
MGSKNSEYAESKEHSLFLNYEGSDTIHEKLSLSK